jgi:hypothetical protein
LSKGVDKNKRRVPLGFNMFENIGKKEKSIIYLESNRYKYDWR